MAHSLSVELQTEKSAYVISVGSWKWVVHTQSYQAKLDGKDCKILWCGPLRFAYYERGGVSFKPKTSNT